MLSYVFALHCIIRTTHVSTYELIKMFKEGRTVPRKGHTQKRDVLADPLYNNKGGYRPGVAVIDDLIVGIENSDGNTNVRFHRRTR